MVIRPKSIATVVVRFASTPEVSSTPMLSSVRYSSVHSGRTSLSRRLKNRLNTNVDRKIPTAKTNPTAYGPSVEPCVELSSVSGKNEPMNSPLE